MKRKFPFDRRSRRVGHVVPVWQAKCSNIQFVQFYIQSIDSTPLCKDVECSRIRDIDIKSAQTLKCELHKNIENAT